MRIMRARGQVGIGPDYARLPPPICAYARRKAAIIGRAARPRVETASTGRGFDQFSKNITRRIRGEVQHRAL